MEGEPLFSLRATVGSIVHDVVRGGVTRMTLSRASRSGSRPSGSIGSARNLIPVAAKIALPIAGATPTIGVSPAPAEGRSLRSRMTTASSGKSESRGTRYCEKRGFAIRPSPNRTASKSAPPIP